MFAKFIRKTCAVCVQDNFMKNWNNVCKIHHKHMCIRIKGNIFMVQNVIEDELTNIKYLQDRHTEDF